MSRKTIAEHAADVLRERGETSINIGDLDLLGEVAKRAEMKVSHPLDRNKAVTAALAKTASGKRLFRIRAKVTLYPGLINAPVNIFVLREEP